VPTQIDVANEILQKNLDKSAGRSNQQWGHLKTLVKTFTKPPSFKHGGKVKKTGIYKLHKGEKVLTAKQAKSHPCLDC